MCFCVVLCIVCFVVLCIVCVYMCTELLPPGGYSIAVKYISYISVRGYELFKIVKTCNLTDVSGHIYCGTFEDYYYYYYYYYYY
jgi:hypothetical protein